MMLKGPHFSGFVAYLRAHLEQMNHTWAEEFDRVLVNARPVLEELGRYGGDPQFALMVLTNARWRRLRSVRDEEYERVLKAIEALLSTGNWQRRLRTIFGPGWFQALHEARGVLLPTAQDLDEGLFEAQGTNVKILGAHSEARHTAVAAWLLDLHAKCGYAKGRRSDLRFLARLLSGFGLQPSDPNDPGRRLEKWLQRARKGMRQQQFFNQVMLYHDVHRAAFVACGSACKPFEETFRRVEEEELQLKEAALMVRGSVTSVRSVRKVGRRKPKGQTE